MERRRLMFMGLAGALTATFGLAAGAQAGVLGDTTGLRRSPAPGLEDETLAMEPGTVADEAEGGVELAQYGGPGPGRGRRGRRCWNETRNVRYRDRFGRVRVRRVTQRVCR